MYKFIYNVVVDYENRGILYTYFEGDSLESLTISSAKTVFKKFSEDDFIIAISLLINAIKPTDI